MGTLISATFPIFPANPAYRALRGTAVLTNGQQLTGRFYYHTKYYNPETAVETYSLYFYSQGPTRLRVLPADSVQRLVLKSKSDTLKSVVFIAHQRHLMQQRTGTPQELNYALFSHL